MPCGGTLDKLGMKVCSFYISQKICWFMLVEGFLFVLMIGLIDTFTYLIITDLPKIESW